MIKLAAASMLLQVGTSLGATSQASLMQVQSLAMNSASMHRQATLAQFQAFADQLVKEHKSGAAMEPGVSEAINSILLYIDQMYDEMWTYHEQDVNAVKCPQAQACNTTWWSAARLSNLTYEKNDLLTKKTNHFTCRDTMRTSCQDYPYESAGIFPADWHYGDDGDEGDDTVDVVLVQTSGQTRSNNAGFATCTIDATICAGLEPTIDHCTEYDNYRKSLGEYHMAKPAKPLPEVVDCMGDDDHSPPDDFKVSYITAPIGSENLAKMESCLVDTHTWFLPLYEKYSRCKCRKCQCQTLPAECLGHQEEFELATCTYEKTKREYCNAYTLCWNTQVAACGLSSDLCNTIAKNVKGRKVDNETGERIKCLLHILNDTDGLTADQLLICTNTEYNTDIWDIACPGDLSCPMLPVDCTAEPVPCEAAFKQSQYASFNDFNMTDPHENPETQVGECKPCIGSLMPPGLTARTCPVPPPSVS